MREVQQSDLRLCLSVINIVITKPTSDFRKVIVLAPRRLCGRRVSSLECSHQHVVIGPGSEKCLDKCGLLLAGNLHKTATIYQMPHFDLTLEPAQSRVIVLSFNCLRLTFQQNLRNITNGQKHSWMIWFEDSRNEKGLYSHCKMSDRIVSWDDQWQPWPSASAPAHSRSSGAPDFLWQPQCLGWAVRADLTPSNTGVCVTSGDQGGKPWDGQGYCGDLWTTLKTIDFIR